MKFIVCNAFGGPENLLLTEGPALLAGPGEVLIAVEAAGVGYVDIMAREGRYPLVSSGGFVPGFEVAGTIAALGEGVEPGWRGRRVFAMPRTGGYAESVAIAADKLFPLPPQVTAADAVALGINGLVAKIGLERVALKSGETALVRGASGGIGLMAVQMATQTGASVTAVTSSVARGERLKQLGAAIILNRTSDEDRSADDYDVIVDTVGGAEIGDFIGRLRANGRYILCGGVAGLPPADFGMSLMANFHKSPAFFIFSLNSIGDGELRVAAEEMFATAAQGKLQAIIDAALPLAKAAESHRRLEAGEVFGKLVLMI